MKRLTKILFTFLLLIPLFLGYSSTTSAESEKKQAKNQIIIELKKEIEDLESKPVNRGFKNNSQYIAALEEQLEKLNKEKEKEKELKLAKDKMIKEIEDEIKALGGSPVIKDDDQEKISSDEDVVALKKQLEDLKKEKADKKKKDDADKKAKKEEEEKKQKRAETIVRVKKEIYFLGGTPILEFEVESDDQYIAALRKQIEELEIQKEAEEKEIVESIPEWFIKMPQGSDNLMYVRGTNISDTLQNSINNATNEALRELGKKLQTRLDSKAKQTIKQAGIGEDLASKTEINDILSVVLKEVTISGYVVQDTKMVPLDNGNYRTFVLLKYPVVKAYKTYIDKIDNSPKLKGRLTEIKNTDAYKELEKAVAQYSGS